MDVGVGVDAECFSWVCGVAMALLCQHGEDQSRGNESEMTNGKQGYRDPLHHPTLEACA